MAGSVRLTRYTLPPSPTALLAFIMATLTSHNASNACMYISFFSSNSLLYTLTRSRQAYPPGGPATPAGSSNRICSRPSRGV